MKFLVVVTPTSIYQNEKYYNVEAIEYETHDEPGGILRRKRWEIY